MLTSFFIIIKFIKYALNGFSDYKLSKALILKLITLPLVVYQ